MALIASNIPELKLISRGKVRDIYELDEKSILIVTTDRMSAFDVILDEPIHGKGLILNQLALFWMRHFAHIVPNQIIEDDVDKYPDILKPYKEQLQGRSVIAKRAKTLPIECIVRGYVTGSGWKSYKESGQICGHMLPLGLLESAKLDKPLFTPSTKAEIGEHDENITLEQAYTLIGKEMCERVQNISLQIYKEAREYAEKRGIIIADTKFEFGIVDGELTLIDEVLTPDSSRFWPLSEYAEGRGQASFDKQYLRDWLETQDWDKKAPAPRLPKEISENTAKKYQEAFDILTK